MYHSWGYAIKAARDSKERVEPHTEQRLCISLQAPWTGPQLLSKRSMAEIFRASGGSQA